MTDTPHPANATPAEEPTTGKVKLVAEMPGDEEMREHLEEMKRNDGYPGSCGT
ncbi:hypothetical protein [Paenibacillus tyrfis]|uniref:hypothetical protein n=1 Tax=Paenibacillus tyrfis TaxID=1501230 RepID=UPI0015C657B3|nr:hypothetical protein [Paenibacillus tyrfis]